MDDRKIANMLVITVIKAETKEKAKNPIPFFIITVYDFAIKFNILLQRF